MDITGCHYRSFQLSYDIVVVTIIKGKGGCGNKAQKSNYANEFYEKTMPNSSFHNLTITLRNTYFENNKNYFFYLLLLCFAEFCLSII